MHMVDVLDPKLSFFYLDKAVAPAGGYEYG